MRLIITLLLLPLFTTAQNRTADSTKHYERQLRVLTIDALTKLRESSEYKTTVQQLIYHKSKSDKYFALMIYGEVAGANFDELNKTIVPKGFPAMDGPAYRFGIGFSGKKGRRIIDFHLSTFGINRKSKKGNEVIKSNFSNLFQLDMGYDLIPSQSINIYPYAGIALRSTDLRYKRSGQTNPNYTDITDILLNEMESYGSSFRIGYQAGLGFDFVIGKSAGRTGGTMVFVKAGINQPIGKETYKIDGIKYRPGIEYGNWIVTAGFKFFDR